MKVTQTDRTNRYRGKLKASGGKRLTVAIESEVVKALAEIMGTRRHKSEAGAVASALMAYRDKILAMPTLEMRVEELERRLAMLEACGQQVADIQSGYVAITEPSTKECGQQYDGKRDKRKTDQDHMEIARVFVRLKLEHPGMSNARLAPMLQERFPEFFMSVTDAQSWTSDGKGWIEQAQEELATEPEACQCPKPDENGIPFTTSVFEPA